MRNNGTFAGSKAKQSLSEENRLRQIMDRQAKGLERPDLGGNDTAYPEDRATVGARSDFAGIEPGTEVKFGDDGSVTAVSNK